MTRKDYQLLASHIDEAVARGCITAEGVGWIADALEHDNWKFDRRRFFKACGVSEWER